MSKSRGNVVAPDEYVGEYGADAVRCYLMFIGPWDQGGSWSESGINGVSRWLNRLWELAQRDPGELDAGPVDENAAADLRRSVHKTIRRVVDYLERFKFNTAIASLMELSNTMNAAWADGGITSDAWSEAVESLLVLLAPMAPHVTEELWERTGRPFSIHDRLLPEWDPALAADETVTLVVQVNGRLRDRIELPVPLTEEDASAAALDSPRVQTHTAGKNVVKVVYVPGKLVNIVAK